MSDHVIAIGALVAVFALGTAFPVHLGALAIVAAFAVGTTVAGESADGVFGGFPGDLFVVLVGVTLLFAMAERNGTVDWLVQQATRAARGRVAPVPWVMFLITALLTAMGAVVPAAVAIVAPIGMSLARRYAIHPTLMGLMVVNGASAGGFSPLGVFGTITNGVLRRNELPTDPGLLFVCSFLFNVALCLVAFFLFGGRRLKGRRLPTASAAGGEGEPLAVHRADVRAGAVREATGPAAGGAGSPAAVHDAVQPGHAAPPVAVPLDTARVCTLLGLLALVAGVLFLRLDVGVTALGVATALSLVSPRSAKGAVERCAWPTVLLVCGIVTYVGLLERMGTIDALGEGVAAIPSALLGALLICLLAAVVSAFASTTGILGALIPLAVPFLLGGEVGAVALVIALAICASVADASPFSTSGALVTANAPDTDRERVFRQLALWGLVIVPGAPVVTWAVFVLPGW